MPQNKTSYNSGWAREYKWIDKVTNDEFAAYCKICKKKFSDKQQWTCTGQTTFSEHKAQTFF